MARFSLSRSAISRAMMCSVGIKVERLFPSRGRVGSDPRHSWRAAQAYAEFGKRHSDSFTALTFYERAAANGAKFIRYELSPPFG